MYNQNDSKKMEAYNSNAEQKQEAYNSNHTTKLTTYDTNAEQHTTDYNANASEKLTTYNANAEQHTTDYNRNAEVKLEAYNQNHTEKVAEYNQNAEIKKAEFDANVGEQIAEKANIDGYYEEMTVGDAEQLISTQFVEDNKPYLFRPTGGSSDVGNRAYLDKIIGGTVAWNQLIRAMRGSGSEKGLTFTRNADGSLNISGTIAEEFSYNYVPFTFTGIKFKRDGRKYLLMLNKPIPYAFGVSGYGATISANSVGGMWSNNAGTDWVNGLNFRANVGTTIDIQNLRAMVFDITQMFGSTIADYIYSLEQSQAGAGVAWFKKLFPKDYYPYNAGELLSVEGLQSHDTVGFNQWDEALESVGLNAETGLPFADTRWFGTKNFIPIFPSTAYYYKIPTRATYGRLCFYDVDKNFISYRGTSAVMNNIFITPQNAHYMKFTLTKSEYGTTYKNDICINLSDPSRNGEYEPYEKHSYPLDNSLTLRGIPKLDASNNLYYDGDEYTSDGKVKRKYGIVDLGTLDWRLDGSAYTFGKKTWLPDRDNFGAIIVGYDFVKSSTDATNLDKVYKTIRFDAGHGAIYIKDKSYADATSFKQAMSGVMLVYELATPTAETAEPFQHIQIVDDFGTEEFVNTGIVPVGHKTRYPANLRDKLQHLPDLASADGTYLIKQSGKQMSLVHMPAVFHDTPTEDGTYTLKAVITGGVATLQWVAE